MQKKSNTSRPDTTLPEDVTTSEEEDTGSTELPAIETSTTSEDTESSKRLDGALKALKESREREKSLQEEVNVSRLAGMEEDDKLRFQLEQEKQARLDLEQRAQYYEQEVNKRDILEPYKHAKQFRELFYGTPEEIKAQADRVERYIEEKLGVTSEETANPPEIDRDNPATGEQNLPSEKGFDNLDVDEMKKLLPRRR